MHISKRFRPSRGDSENNMKDVFETNENAHEKWMRKSKIVMRVCLSCERADQQGKMEKAETLQIKNYPPWEVRKRYVPERLPESIYSASILDSIYWSLRTAPERAVYKKTIVYFTELLPR